MSTPGTATPAAKKPLRRRLALAVGLLALGAIAVPWLRGRDAERHYTGFVEGEERVVRSEVAGRVLEVAFHEGDRVPADAVLARLDDSELAARLASREQEIAVLDAQVSEQNRPDRSDNCFLHM
jgi:multidrug efflux pump subunit AcrA (membrane-fusion protein)